MALIIGPGHSAYEYLRETSQRLEIRDGVVVVAWARSSGVGLLYEALGDGLLNVDVFVGMANRGTSAEALGHLTRLSRRVFVYHKHHLQTFHPKVYLFDDGEDPPRHAALLVGSSNLTGGGLYQNIEANLALDLSPFDREDHRVIYDSVVQGTDELRDSPFCEELDGDERIRQLLDDRYISNEAVLRRKRRRDNREVGRLGDRRQRPEAPPPRLPGFALPPLDVIFDEPEFDQPDVDVVVDDPLIDEGLGPDVDVVVDDPLIDEGLGPDVDVVVDDLLIDEGPGPDVYDPEEQFYVRTLTQTDVNRLRGNTAGTAEWNIGVAARTARPGFWGWPDLYENAEDGLQRLEWRVAGSLQSAVTGEAGEDVDIVLWFREARPGHAAEHRLRVGPTQTLLRATPDNFDTASLVVVERLPNDRNQRFLIRLLTAGDPGYEDFFPYLAVNRPGHRFGYGP